MKKTHLNNCQASLYEKRCYELWRDISQQSHQPIEYDLNADILEINYSNDLSYPQYVKKDFRIFEKEAYRFFERIAIKIHDTEVSVTPLELAKLVFLMLMQGRKPQPSSITSAFNGICMFFSLMKERPIDAHLGKSDYLEYYGLNFGFDPTLGGLVKRLSAPSYASVHQSLKLRSAIKIYRSLHLPFTFDNLTKNLEISLLNQVCLDVMGLTFRDYYRGGSFNFLGLEIGKHYIDHCANVFEDNFQFALALRKTYSNIERVLEGVKMPVAENNKSAIIGNALTGKGIDSVDWLSSCTVEEPHNLLIDEFRKQYNSCATLSSINKFKVIIQIIETAGLPDRFDTYEFVRSILIAEYINDFSKPSEVIFSEYIAALNVDDSFYEKKGAFTCTHEKFIDICKKVVSGHSLKLSKNVAEVSSFIKQNFSAATFVSKSLVGVPAINRFCLGVESAACTLFVAITGWRRSEFGFPMSDVGATINAEPLDNLYTPWRFNVNWRLPKTHGDAKIDREITSYGYQIAQMASQINLAGIEKPALYRPQLKKTTDEALGFDSSTFVAHRVEFLWLDFIKNYTLFDDAKIKKHPEVNDLKISLNNAIEAYEFWQNPKKHKVFKRYREGILDETTTKLLNKKLSNETQEFLNGDYAITISTSRRMVKELMSDLPYPTPHAFRHIWAEAVLTRYRGDIGKFLRANFKHMDARFYSAYLRNKEMAAVHKIAERTVINQIVRTYIRSANDEYHGYAGGFQRYVSKAAKMTKVITLEEQERLVDKISSKVISIKANSWSTCMLRLGNKQSAKCAEDGVPQRRNASPEFCLGCIHADISEMNYEGIVLSVKDDVMACRNPNLPDFMKTLHMRALKVALARVKALRKNSGKTSYDRYIDYLEESMQIAAQKNQE